MLPLHRQPLPVNLERKDLKAHLERAVSNTYMNRNPGNCVAVKIGNSSQSVSQVHANLAKALPIIITHIKGEWDNVQSLNLTMNEGIALPIWTCDLGSEDGGRFAGMTADPEDTDRTEVEVSSWFTQGGPKKGKKRTATMVEGKTKDLPAKRVKASIDPIPSTSGTKSASGKMSTDLDSNSTARPNPPRNLPRPNLGKNHLA